MITIENNGQLIYINIQESINIFGLLDETFTDLPCSLLLGENNKLLGIEIDLSPLNSLYDLNRIVEDNYYEYDVSISNNTLRVLIDGVKDVTSAISLFAHLDIFGCMIYGIEVILPEYLKINDDRIIRTVDEIHESKDYIRLANRLDRIVSEVKRTNSKLEVEKGFDQIERRMTRLEMLFRNPK